MLSSKIVVNANQKSVVVLLRCRAVNFFLRILRAVPDKRYVQIDISYEIRRQGTDDVMLVITGVLLIDQ